MRVFIAGAGNMGKHVAQDLHAAGHDVTVIEQDPELVGRLSSTLPVTWVVADACEVTSLREARLDLADVIVAATGDDEDNLVISLLAKQEFAVPRVLARVNHPGNQWLFDESWGVDVAVSPPHILTGLVEEAVSVGALVRLLHLGQGEARLVEITLAAGSPAVGAAIAELTLPRDVTIVAVLRSGHVVVPRGTTTLREGDEVIALVAGNSEERLKLALIGG
jgi:trk system potassium uptake protein TrkA